jgi:amino acid adenylation domain-containing protein
VDLAGLPPELRRIETLRLAAAEARTGFDLARGPLARAVALRLGPADHLLVVGLHHIVADGWSVGILLREMAALYRSFLRREPSHLPALAVQYKDYALWQRRWLQGETLEGLLSYWRGHLGEGPVPSRLPADRPAERPGEAARQPLVLSAEAVRALRTVGRRHDATLFMTVLAALTALLHRYSGESRIAVGVPVAGRDRVEIEGLIGCFVNTLVMQSPVAGDATFASLLGRVRETALGAYDHGALPFDRLVEELQPERAAGQPPLVQVVLNVQKAPPLLELEGLSVEPLDLPPGPAKLDLIVSLEEREDGVRGALEYDAGRFDAATVLRLAGHLERLLAAVAADPEALVRALPVQSEGELQQLTREWTATESPYPGAAIHELFQEIAGSFPDDVAVVAGNRRLTYAELNADANRLARRLRRLGVDLDVRVGVLLERSAEMITVLLAILKAGGAYVPLDPAYPADRLAFLVQDSRTPVLVSRTELVAKLPPHGERQILLDTDAGALSRESALDLRPLAGPDDLAYVMYTSGSTGRPKGVAVVHRAVARLVLETGYARFGHDEVFLHLAPSSFDASTLEIWGPLLHGGRLVVFQGQPASMDEIADALASHGVTSLWLTAGLFHQMVDLRLEGLAPLRQLLAGGDVLSAPHVRRVLRQLPGCRLINGYGPTENTTFTCCHPMDDAGDVGETVPIGRPIANTRVYVLGAGFEPVPVGVPGELLTGGDGLARGYHERPDLTAELFVPDPFSERPGARLYRTGDLVRHRHDGRIELLGRRDGQIKIRGFRIEPGEVEASLASLPGVRAAAVVVREDRPGDRRLVGYAVPDPEVRGVTAEGLRSALRGRLPAFMVPSDVMVLGSLPLGPNGKVDRRALPASGLEREEAAAAAVPRSLVEEELAEIAAELLGMPDVGIEDDFFERGGHSLLATQMVGRVRRTFGVDVPLRAFFESPTVAALAQAVEEGLRGGKGPASLPIERRPRDLPLPLSPAQMRLWFLQRLDPDSPAFLFSAATRIEGPLHVPALERTLSLLVERHEALRTTFHEVLEAAQVVQVVAPPAPLPLAVVDLGGLPPRVREAEARRLAVSEAQRPFRLDRDLLLRARLLRYGPCEHAVLLAMHHIVYDAWSLGVFFRELEVFYSACLEGRRAALPELAVQYPDYAGWHVDWLSSPASRAQLDYWRRRLADLRPLELPFQRPGTETRSFRGEAHPVRLSGELCRDLRRLSGEEGCTLFMVLLAGFQTLLHLYTGSRDVAVGTNVANRGRSEIEGVVGFFVNTLVLRTDLSGDPTFRELLGRVREVALGAYAHQDVPLETLIEVLQPERGAGRSPFFQAKITFQNAPLKPLRLPELKVTPLDMVPEGAPFDLLLDLHQVEGAITGFLKRRADLFDAADIGRMVERLEDLLRRVAADPGLRLSELSLGTGTEMQRMLAEFSIDLEAC